MAAPFDDDPGWTEPIPRRFGRGPRLVGLVVAVAVLLAAVVTVVVRDDGSQEVFAPGGSGARDLQRFSEAIRADGTEDAGPAPAGPAELAADVELVVLGRITGFHAGRVMVAPPEYALPDQRMVSMRVAVEEVVRGRLPAGSGGVLEVELGVLRSRQPRPSAVAEVAPADRPVALYLTRAEDRAVFELREPGEDDAGADRLRWWAAHREAFLMDDGEGGVVSLLDGREWPGARLADLLPPAEAWPTIERAPSLACPPGDGLTGVGPSSAVPVLAAVDPSGTAAPPRWPAPEDALTAFAATVRGFPHVEGPIGPSADRGGYAVVFESLTNRTIAYRGEQAEVLAVFYATGTDDTGWRIEGFQACTSWYEALPELPESQRPT